MPKANEEKIAEDMNGAGTPERISAFSDGVLGILERLIGSGAKSSFSVSMN